MVATGAHQAEWMRLCLTGSKGQETVHRSMAEWLTWEERGSPRLEKGQSLGGPVCQGKRALLHGSIPRNWQDLRRWC